MTIAPRWRKMWRDLGDGGLARLGLAVLAMAAGTFGIGMVLTSYSILGRELARTFEDTRPASAWIIADPVRDALANSLRAIPGVSEVEIRATIRGRWRVGPDEWAPMVLFAVRDFESQQLDRFRPDSGAWPPGEGEVLLERTALSVARAKIGDRVVVKTAGGSERSMRVAGTVHAAGLAPSWMDHVVSGFVPWNSIARGDTNAEATAYRIGVTGDRKDPEHILAVARRVRGELERRGVRVDRIEMPTPGRHPHADQMDTFLFLLGAFGALTLCLSAVLVTSTIYTLLTKQVRQVGIMKTIGASSRQIAALYLAQVLVLATIALVLGIPLGLAAGRGYAQFAATMLNADLASLWPPAWVLLAVLGVGLVVPLLTALGPVWSASRVSVHQALQQELGQQAFGARRLDRWVARIGGLPRPLMLVIRTTARRRERLMLTVATLAVGGGAFIAALNVSAGWDRVIVDDFNAHHYDLDVRFSRPEAVNRLASAIGTVPSAVHAEYWTEADAMLPAATGSGHDRIRLIGPDTGTKLLSLPLLAGRWIAAENPSGVVINHALATRHPTAGVGKPLRLRVGRRTVSWTVVGIVKEVASAPAVYAAPALILAATGQSPDTTSGIRIVTVRHDAVSQVAAAAEVERALKRTGIEVAGIHPRRDQLKALQDHLVIITSALLLAAGLVVLVGGLGLTSTLALNVLERTREIGVLAALGATPRTIAGFVVVEGLLIGLLSFGVAIAIAVPITLALDNVAGRLFIRTPLDFTMAPRALVGWLLGVAVLAAASSLYPARRAARMSVREALAYE